VLGVKNNNIVQKKHSANFIDYLGFLLGLKCETITKIANKIQQFPKKIIQETPNI
jgi:hypothetical protein